MAPRTASSAIVIRSPGSGLPTWVPCARERLLGDLLAGPRSEDPDRGAAPDRLVGDQGRADTRHGPVRRRRLRPPPALGPSAPSSPATARPARRPAAAPALARTRDGQAPGEDPLGGDGKERGRDRAAERPCRFGQAGLLDEVDAEPAGDRAHRLAVPVAE